MPAKINVGPQCIFEYPETMTSIDTVVGPAQHDPLFETLKRNYEIFGITNFARYDNTSILEDNLKNLEAYDKKKPVALAICCRHEKGVEFFGTSLGQRLGLLSQGYNLFVCEVDNSPDAFLMIEYIGKKYGQIELLQFSGHGNRLSICLGEYDEALSSWPAIIARKNLIPHKQAHISVLNEDEIALAAKYISEKAKVILDSCSTGKGEEEEDNLANFLARALPGRMIFSAPFNVSDTLFTLDERGLVGGVRFRRSISKTDPLPEPKELYGLYMAHIP